MKSMLRIAALMTGLAGAMLAQAQSWPTRPVTVVVNFAPGGAADQLARIVGAHLQQALGQPMVVENKAGAGGNLGGEFVAKAAPDGYTLLISSGGMVSINPHLYQKLSFDPTKDLVPVASVARVPFYLAVRADSPVKDFNALLANLKANPGKRSFGSLGNGSSPHLAGEMLTSRTGTSAIHVPYRGAAPALTDLKGGQIDFLFGPGISLQHVKTGKLRMLAVASPQRAPLVPEVPTLDELGFKGFDADAVFGLYAPAGTPASIVTRLNAEINRALSESAVKERIIAIGNVPQALTPDAFGQKGAEDFRRFGTVFRERGIKGD